MYEDKIKKQEEETQLLKKTILEQSLARLNQLSEGESNSLESSSGLKKSGGMH